MNSFTKDELTEIAEVFDLPKMSRLKKKEMIDRIAVHILNEQTMIQYFSCLDNEQIEEFERLLAGTSIDGMEQEKLMYQLVNLLYVICDVDNVFSVSTEVAELYPKINTPEFHALRERRIFLLKCLEIAGCLYGIFSFEILSKLCQKIVTKQEKAQWNIDFLKTEIEQLPRFFNEFIVLGDRIIAEDIFMNDREEVVLRLQGDKPFYFPTRGEVEKYAMWKHFPEDKHLVKFKKYLEQKHDLNELASAMIAFEIQASIINNSDIDSIFRMLEGKIEIRSQREFDELAQMVFNVWNNTRLVMNRGHKASELKKDQKFVDVSHGKNQGRGINLEEQKKKKVYANEPCPCGSGKKYKRCCGR